MLRDFEVLPGGKEGPTVLDFHPQKQLRHFRNISGSLVQNALDTWGEIWDQLQGSLTHGVMVVPEMEKNFEPECGWPEFLEKMWLLRHYLDQTKRFCEGKE